MESDSCRDPEQIFICKIFSQHKEQSAPFFEITEKFSFLLGAFPHSMRTIQ